MSSSHFVTLTELSLCGDEDLDGLLHSWRELIAFALLEALYVYDDAFSSVWNLERRITDFLRLLSKDGVEELEFRSHVAFALWSDLSNKDVTRMHHGSNLDDALFIKHLKHLLIGVWNVTGELLGTKLGLSDIGRELLYMYGCIDIILYDPL